MKNTPPHGSLATRLAALQQQVAGARGLGAGGEETPLLPAARRPSPPATLIGVSKTQPVEVLEEALRLGLRDFGENRVQEAEAKWPALKTRYPDLRLHLIGPLQSNKAAEAVALFDVIHTIDRVKIAQAIFAEGTKQGRLPRCLMQVNTGEEPQKAGVSPRAAAALLAECRALGLPIVGLMCIPPEGINPAPHFALLKCMADRFGLTELSMGMSSDYDVALRLGATLVRVGTALFGERASAH